MLCPGHNMVPMLCPGHNISLMLFPGHNISLMLCPGHNMVLMLCPGHNMVLMLCPRQNIVLMLCPGHKIVFMLCLGHSIRKLCHFLIIILSPSNLLKKSFFFLNRLFSPLMHSKILFLTVLNSLDLDKHSILKSLKNNDSTGL
jgi:hypothetical protein